MNLKVDFHIVLSEFMYTLGLGMIQVSQLKITKSSLKILNLHRKNSHNQSNESLSIQNNQLIEDKRKVYGIMAFNLCAVFLIM